MHSKTGCKPDFGHLLYHDAAYALALIIDIDKISSEALTVGKEANKIISNNFVVLEGAKH